MKKLIQLCAIAFGMLFTTSAFAGVVASSNQGPAQGNWGGQGNCGQAASQPGNPGDSSTGECYCKFVTYKPNYYCTPRCVEEKIPYKETHCRYVDQCYDVQRCRMVPEYYTETLTRKVPEYYEVEKCRTCTRTEYDTQCEWIPQYYWKHTCATPVSQPACGAPAPQGCSSGQCGR